MLKCNFPLTTLPDLPLLPLFYRDVLSAGASISKHTVWTKTTLKMRSCGIITKSLSAANLFLQAMV